MDELLHPGMIRFPCKLPTSNGFTIVSFRGANTRDFAFVHPPYGFRVPIRFEFQAAVHRRVHDQEPGGSKYHPGPAAQTVGRAERTAALGGAWVIGSVFGTSGRSSFFLSGSSPRNEPQSKPG